MEKTFYRSQEGITSFGGRKKMEQELFNTGKRKFQENKLYIIWNIAVSITIIGLFILFIFDSAIVNKYANSELVFFIALVLESIIYYLLYWYKDQISNTKQIKMRVIPFWIGTLLLITVISYWKTAPSFARFFKTPFPDIFVIVSVLLGIFYFVFRHYTPYLKNKLEESNALQKQLATIDRENLIHIINNLLHNCQYCQINTDDVKEVLTQLGYSHVLITNLTKNNDEKTLLSLLQNKIISLTKKYCNDCQHACNQTAKCHTCNKLLNKFENIEDLIASTV